MCPVGGLGAQQSLNGVAKLAFWVVALSQAGIPMVLLRVSVFLLCTPTLQRGTPIDCAELFAGCCSVTSGLRAVGFSCIPFEIKMMSDGMMALR
eukprot:5410984-Alexandrium_andersonii.AAC.1